MSLLDPAARELPRRDAADGEMAVAIMEELAKRFRHALNTL
jgi:hypothetical protein